MLPEQSIDLFDQHSEFRRIPLGLQLRAEFVVTWRRLHLRLGHSGTITQTTAEILYSESCMARNQKFIY